MFPLMYFPSDDLASQFPQNSIKFLTYIPHRDLHLPSSLLLPIFTTEEFSIFPDEDAPSSLLTLYSLPVWSQTAHYPYLQPMCRQLWNLEPLPGHLSGLQILQIPFRHFHWNMSQKIPIQYVMNLTQHPLTTHLIYICSLSE